MVIGRILNRVNRRLVVGFAAIGFMNAVLFASEANAGGGAIADFDSLINLIQTTVEPNSWEALGGVSTMAPYPAGIAVDPAGLVRESVIDERAAVNPARARSRDINAALLPSADASMEPGDWRSPAKIRCVSLRRLLQTLATNDERQKDEAINSMAGLSRVRLLIVTDEDILLCGTVGGFIERDGWMIDRVNGLAPMTFTSFAVGLSACLSNVPFGCTIDPKTERLAAATAVGARINRGELAIGLGAEQLGLALGRQDVRVFGTSPNHEVAWLMVEADRHMKQLALGAHPMPQGVQNYVNTIGRLSPEKPPGDMLLRLWFTPQAMDARSVKSDATDVIQVVGTPLQLSGANELSLPAGQRGHHVVDPITQAFVEHFNQQWVTIRSKYPIYGALESVYHATAITRLWTTHGVSDDHDVMRKALLHFASERCQRLPSPTEVDSIAVSHSYRHGRVRHHLLIASGGVEIQPESLIGEKPASYRPLAEYASLTRSKPDQRWWWNASVSPLENEVSHGGTKAHRGDND